MIIYYAVLGIVTFVVWGVDKLRAKERRWRIPETRLLTLALLGGAFGALLGMLVFRHKTRKPLFWAAVLAGCVIHIGVFIFIQQEPGFSWLNPYFGP